jgi:hypothetical protein
MVDASSTSISVPIHHPPGCSPPPERRWNGPLSRETSDDCASPCSNEGIAFSTISPSMISWKRSPGGIASRSANVALARVEKERPCMRRDYHAALRVSGPAGRGPRRR